MPQLCNFFACGVNFARVAGARCFCPLCGQSFCLLAGNMPFSRKSYCEAVFYISLRLFLRINVYIIYMCKNSQLFQLFFAYISQGVLITFKMCSIIKSEKRQEEALLLCKCKNTAYSASSLRRKYQGCARGRLCIKSASEAQAGLYINNKKTAII